MGERWASRITPQTSVLVLMGSFAEKVSPGMKSREKVIGSMPSRRIRCRNEWGRVGTRKIKHVTSFLRIQW